MLIGQWCIASSDRKRKLKLGFASHLNGAAKEYRQNEEDRVVLNKRNAIMDYDSITTIQSDGSWIQMGSSGCSGMVMAELKPSIIGYGYSYVQLPYCPSMLNPSTFTMLFCGLFITIGIKWNAILTPSSC